MNNSSNFWGENNKNSIDISRIKQEIALMDSIIKENPEKPFSITLQHHKITMIRKIQELKIS